MIRSEKIIHSEATPPIREGGGPAASAEKVTLRPLVVKKWPWQVRLSFILAAAIILWVPILLILL
jgi:hypothetical protein